MFKKLHYFIEKNDKKKKKYCDRIGLDTVIVCHSGIIVIKTKKEYCLEESIKWCRYTI